MSNLSARQAFQRAISPQYRAHAFEVRKLIADAAMCLGYLRQCSTADQIFDEAEHARLTASGHGDALTTERAEVVERIIEVEDALTDAFGDFGALLVSGAALGAADPEARR